MLVILYKWHSITCRNTVHNLRFGKNGPIPGYHTVHLQKRRDINTLLSLFWPLVKKFGCLIHFSRTKKRPENIPLINRTSLYGYTRTGEYCTASGKNCPRIKRVLCIWNSFYSYHLHHCCFSRVSGPLGGFEEVKSMNFYLYFTVKLLIAKISFIFEKNSVNSIVFNFETSKLFSIFS